MTELPLPRPCQIAILVFLDVPALARLQAVSRAFRTRVHEAMALLPTASVNRAALPFATAHCTRLSCLWTDCVATDALLPQLLQRNRASLTSLRMQGGYARRDTPEIACLIDAVLRCKNLTELSCYEEFYNAARTRRLVRQLRGLQRVYADVHGPTLFGSSLPLLKSARWRDQLDLPRHIPLILSHSWLEELDIRVEPEDATAGSLLELLPALARLQHLTSLVLCLPNLTAPNGAPAIVFPRLQTLDVVWLRGWEDEVAGVTTADSFVLCAPNLRTLEYDGLPDAEGLFRRFPGMESVTLYTAMGYRWEFDEEQVAPCLAALREGCWKNLSDLYAWALDLSAFWLPLFSGSPQLQRSLTSLALDCSIGNSVTSGQLRRLLLLLPALEKLVLRGNECGEAKEETKAEEQEAEELVHANLRELELEHRALPLMLSLCRRSSLRFPRLHTLLASKWFNPAGGALLPLLRAAPALVEVSLDNLLRVTLNQPESGPKPADDDEAGVSTRFLTSLRQLKVTDCPRLPSAALLALCTDPDAPVDVVETFLW